MSDFQPIIEALLACEEEKVTALVREAVAGGADANTILKQGLIAGMDIIGERMENGDMFIPEVLMAARAMSAAVEILKPLLADDETGARGRVVLGTVKGDLHDIGKNLVAMMMESAGLEVYNLGVDVKPESFVEAIKSRKANILGLSALLTTTMPMMKETIKAVAAAGLRDTVKILVGGAPVTDGFAREIGADGYAPDAGSAARLAKVLIQ